jgi:hypothetical protein
MRVFRATGILLVMAALPLAVHAAKDYTEIKLVVTDAEKGQPVPKAAITLTFVRGKNVFGKKDRAQWDVKTDSHGMVTVPFIPRGKMKVVVFAKGFQTFGDEVEVAGDEQTIPVKLVLPHGQYSVHDGEVEPEVKKPIKP